MSERGGAGSPNGRRKRGRGGGGGGLPLEAEAELPFELDHAAKRSKAIEVLVAAECAEHPRSVTERGDRGSEPGAERLRLASRRRSS